MDSQDQSAYWFLKGEMQSRAPLNQMDLEQILEMLQNVPAKEMNEAMEQAEMMGDEAAMIVLIMADNKRKFREEYASEDEPSVEKSTAYFSKLKSQNPDLARKIEFSVKNEDELPTEEIEKAGFQEDKIEEWVDLVGVEDSNLVGFERCSDCEGEGFIITNYYPATRYDPADGDFEECEVCAGSGEIDPADYMDKDGNYMAESFEAAEWVGFCPECNKWRTKEMSVKIDSKINTTGWSIPDKLLGKRLCKKSQRFGKIRQSGDTFTGYGSRPFDDSYCGTPLTKVKSKYKAESFGAETKKRKTGFRKCSKCGYSDHNSSNCNRLNEYESYLKHKDEMLKECDDAIQRFTRNAKRYSEDGEYGLAKMLRSDATDMKKLKRMSENNHFGKAVHFAMTMDSDPRELAPSALWMFDSESWLTEGKCAICNSPSKFTVMTAIGERSFCCEACYADYMGLPVEKEGYYGLASETKSMNPYLLGAGIFALTLGLLSRKR